MWWGTPPALPRAWPILDAVRDRLLTATVQGLLGGPGRVYREHEDWHQDPDDRGADPWARLVVLTVQRPGGEAREEPGRGRWLHWVVRAEMYQPAPGFDPARYADELHEEVFSRLHGWRPGRVEGLVVSRGVERFTAHQPVPLWHEASGLWWSAATYRCWIESPDAEF